MSCHLRGADDLKGGLQQRFRGMSDKDVRSATFRAWANATARPRFRSTITSIAASRPPQAEALVLTALGGSELPEMPPFDEKPGRLASDPYPGAEHYGALRKLVVSRDWDGVIAQLKASGLSAGWAARDFRPA